MIVQRRNQSRVKIQVNSQDNVMILDHQESYYHLKKNQVEVVVKL